MRYFTRELWIDAQKPSSNGGPDRWQEAFDQYRSQLEQLKSRVPAAAFDFFANAGVHDGELLDLRIIDGSRPAPIDEPARRWRRAGPHPVRVEMSVVDAYDRLVWNLSYSKLRRVLVDFPSADPIFYSPGDGFGDWGYHELTDAGDGFLRHEILFATGSSLLFEFREFSVNSESRPGNALTQG